MVVALAQCHPPLAAPQQPPARIDKRASPLRLAVHVDLVSRGTQPGRMVVDKDALPLPGGDLIDLMHDTEQAALLRLAAAHDVLVPVVPGLAVHAARHVAPLVQPLVGAEVGQYHHFVGRRALVSQVAAGAEIVVLLAVLVEVLDHVSKEGADLAHVRVEDAERVVAASGELDDDDWILRWRRAAGELRADLSWHDAGHVWIGAHAAPDEEAVDEGGAEVEDGWNNGEANGKD